eukprot:471784_1
MLLLEIISISICFSIFYASVVLPGNYVKLIDHNIWTVVIHTNATHTQLRALMNLRIQITATHQQISDIVSNDLCKQHIRFQELFKSNILAVCMNSENDDTFKINQSSNYNTKNIVSIQQFMQGVDSPSIHGFDTAKFQQDEFYLKYVKNKMINYEHQIKTTIENTNLTHPFFKSFINNTNWLYPLIIYAEESTARQELFDFMKQITYTDIVHGKHFFRVETNYLNIFSYLTVFLYAVAIQKESQLNQTHMHEFMHLINQSVHTPFIYNKIWNLKDTTHWIWSMEYTQNVLNSDYQYIFRGLFMPISTDNEHKLSYTQNMQSFSLDSDGVYQVLDHHRSSSNTAERYWSESQYKIVLLIAPLQLINGWKKLVPLRFPYLFVNEWASMLEKEVILPPFTKYSWIQMNLKLFVNVNYTSDPKQLNYCALHAIQVWKNHKRRLMNVQLLLNNIWSLISYLPRYQFEIRFIDVQKSRIAYWKDWYQLITPNYLSIVEKL